MSVIIWSVGTFASLVMHAARPLCALDHDTDELVDVFADVRRPVAVRSFTRVPL